MLRQLGIESVRLLTNNPAKIAQLERYGIEVAGRVAHVFGANVHGVICSPKPSAAAICSRLTSCSRRLGTALRGCR